MAYDTLKLEVADGIALITLTRPDSLNALDRALAVDLCDAVEAVGEDRSVRVLVLTGEGRGFCAGGDITAFQENVDALPRFLRALVRDFHAGIIGMLDLPIPVIAGVNGIAAGGGMGLFLCADLAIAAESAVFTMAYTGIGATPDGSTTYFLPRMVGTRRAMEMIYLNRKLSAQGALDWGLVGAVVPDPDLPGALQKLAETLRDGPTRAYGVARRLVRESFNTQLLTQLENERAAIVAMGGTGDFKEGIAAFAEKRKPTFTGR